MRNTAKLATLAVAAILLVGFQAAPGWAGQGSPVAQQPVYKTGDEWIYDVTANNYYLGKRSYTVAGETTYRSQSVLGIDSRLVEASSDRVKPFMEDSDLYITPEWVWVGRKRGKGSDDYAEPPMEMFRWPLKVGERWSAIVSFYFEFADFPQTQTQFQVLGYESVTVPAGTFEAFHLKYRGFHPEYPSRASIIDYWYAPAVKNIVRYEGRLWFENTSYVFELASYRLK